MTSETREEVVENGIDGEGKQRKEKKGKMKKDKEKKGVSLGGREAKGGVITKKTDAFGDSHSQRNGDAEQSSKVLASTIASTLARLKKQVENDRSMYVKTTMDANNGKLQAQVAQFFQFAEERGKLSGVEDGTEAKDLLTVRIQKAHCRVSGLDSNALEKDGVNSQEDGSSTFLSLLSGSSPGGKSVVCPVKLPTVEKHPPYTTWIFLDRNQKMVEDQSVLGRRRIYYDQNGSEALICSDSEEEQVDDEDEKHEFSKGEDYIIRRTIEEHGLGETVLETLANCTEAKPCEIEARYEALQNEDLISQENFIDDGAADSKIPLIEGGKPLGCLSRKIYIKDESEMQESVSFKSNPGEETNFDDKDLAAAMDSFDNLFCRRCLVFDCRLHGCSQTVIIPTEKQPAWSDPEGAGTPCGPSCRLLKYCEGKGDNAIDSGKSAKAAENSKWTKLEKGLYEKGLEIFGKNRLFSDGNIVLPLASQHILLSLPELFCTYYVPEWSITAGTSKVVSCGMKLCWSVAICFWSSYSLWE